MSIVNEKLGFRKAFVRSGLPLLVGICYVAVGVLVFLMKPHFRSSWVFYLSTASFGALIMFLFKVGRLHPTWLGTVHILLYALTPATFFHLALNFPERLDIVIDYPWLQLVPYVLTLAIFIGIRSHTDEMLGVSRVWYLILVIYLFAGLITFIGACFRAWFRSRSEIVRSRSKLILLGTLISASVPLADTFINAIFKISIVPSFNYYLPFLLIFPIVIGYTIIKHNLFDINGTIRRTFSYLLTTLAVALFYGLFIVLPMMFAGQMQMVRSPLYPVVIILLFLLTFSLVRDRVQQFIGRIFYGLEYDYRETIQRASETLRSLMQIDKIGKSILETACGSMFIDTASVMLLDTEGQRYRCLVSAAHNTGAASTPQILPASTSTDQNGKQTLQENSVIKWQDEDPAGKRAIDIPVDEPLLQKVAERKKMVTLYDVHEDPYFEDNKELYEALFDRLQATLIVPLIYEERLTGLISLGRKKSGRFYCREDIQLISTIANQGAVAIENARMVEKIIEKERTEAKIMDVFGKYVTHEIRDQILTGDIPLDGEIKEVTVLFADLRDFTALAESTPPKEIVRMINGYFSEMAESIREHNGLVLQFIGDEIMAVFGAPVPLDNHPVHAVKAGLDMRLRLSRVNSTLEGKDYGPLRHGIGIHTGSVVAANIGSEDRKSYALVGDPVNMASRIQELTKEFETDILISETTRSWLSNDIQVRRLPTREVRGKSERVSIFQVD